MRRRKCRLRHIICLCTLSCHIKSCQKFLWNSHLIHGCIIHGCLIRNILCRALCICISLCLCIALYICRALHFFLTRVLVLRVDRDGAMLAESEPFTLDGLEQFQLRQ